MMLRFSHLSFGREARWLVALAVVVPLTAVVCARFIPSLARHARQHQGS